MKLSSRILIIPALLIIFSINSLAQEPTKHDERREKYRSMKIAYFTENLDLTTDEAERFWPLYNEYEKQKGAISKRHRLKTRESDQNAEISEKEAEEIIDNNIKARQDETSLDVKFHQDLKKILSAKKIMNLYITEVQFREFMLKQYRSNQRQGGGKRERQDP